MLEFPENPTTSDNFQPFRTDSLGQSKGLSI